jgi:hypothetical protein
VPNAEGLDWDRQFCAAFARGFFDQVAASGVSD